MAVLMINPEVMAEVERVKALALTDPVDVAALAETIKTPEGKRAHMDKMGALTIDIPIGYIATFSVEKQPKGLARHLSVSITREGKLPSLEAVWAIALGFGFTGSLKECTVWVETLQRDDIRVDCPNIVQYIHADVVGHA